MRLQLFILAITLGSINSSYAALKVTSVLPKSGSTDGGSLITLYGDGFNQQTSVMIGEVKCTKIRSFRPTALTCITPRGRPGLVSITLKNTDESTAKLESAFTYITPKKLGNLTGSLGFSKISYTQSRISDYSSWVVTLKGMFQRQLPRPNWDFAVGGYFTLLPLKTNIPGIMAQFLGLNLRIGYSVPGIIEPWKLNLMGGWYYTTMIVTNNYMGFHNLAGPQLFPVLRRSFGKSSAFGYFKYSPVTNGLSLSFLPISNREIAFGGGWSTSLPNRNSFSLMLDVANLSMTIKSWKITSSSVSLSAGYGF